MMDLIDESDTKSKERYKYTNDELLEYLRQFFEENGRIPMNNDFNNNPKYPSFNTYAKRFGSWNDALKMAGLQISVFTKISDNELLKYLEQFYKENGRHPTRRDFSNNSKYPSYITYVNRFGGWNKTLKLVGLDIDTMVKKGILGNNNHKGRLFEIYVLEHFTERPVDVSGDRCGSPFDGICPKGEIYDAKSVGLIDKRYWSFPLDRRGGVDFYYLGAFDKDYRKLLHVWRVPEGFIDRPNLYIGIDNNYTYNVDNMKEYEITDKFKDIDLFK